jgi:hypothetical protein
MREAGATLEASFWSNVWQCMPRHPCKKCCWPWTKCDVSANWRFIWQQHALFYHKDLPGRRMLPVHRVAYELTHGLLVIRGHTFHLCHQCHFGPCCNPAHLRVGSASDNARDTRERLSQRMIVLPDGQRWASAQAWAADKAFYEARHYQRVFAGPIPERFQMYNREALDHPSINDWPGPRPIRSLPHA